MTIFIIFAIWSIIGLLGTVISCFDFMVNPDMLRPWSKAMFIFMGGPVIWLAVGMRYIFS